VLTQRAMPRAGAGRMAWLLAGTLAAMLLASSAATATVVRTGTGHRIGVSFQRGLVPAALLPTSATARTASQTSSGQLNDNGGPVLHSSTPYLIFWAPAGETIPAGTESLLARYFADVAHASGAATDVYAVGRQYTDGTGFAEQSESWSSAHALTDTYAYPTASAKASTGCPYVTATYRHCLTESQLQAELQRELTAAGLPADGASTSAVPANAPVYFVLLPSDVDTCFTAGSVYCAAGGSGGFCSYHDYFTETNGANVLFATIPTAILAGGQNPKVCQDDGNSALQEPNGNPGDVVLKYLSHEDNETQTDPFMSSWYNDATSNEDGDNCNVYGANAPASGSSPNAFTPTLGGSAASGSLYNQLIGGDPYYLQSEWSNGDGGCEMQPTAGEITPSLGAPAGPDVAGTTLSFDPAASASTFPFTSATWNFGDGTAPQFEGSSSPTATVNHDYTSPGTYTATLTLVDDRGNLATVSQSVTVYSTPHAAYTVSANPVQGAPTTFDASASSDSDPGVTITGYTWHFGDGTGPVQSTTPVIPHTYAQPGDYTTSVTVSTNVGVSGTTSQTVSVDEAPSAVITLSPASPLVGQAVSFSGSGSADPDGQVVAWSWSFGDGSAPGTGASVSHTYTQAGDYPVSLTVTDSDGHTATQGETLIVGSAPDPQFSVVTTSPVQGSPVALDASASTDTDPGVTITSYNWNFGDGTSATTATPTETHTYTQPGSYTITLTTTNSIGLSASVSHVSTVDEVPSAVFSPFPAQPTVGQTVSFDGSGSNDPDGEIVNWSWNYGDGSPVDSSQSAFASHIYAQAGIYPVTLTVTDSDGHTSSQTEQITVGTPPQPSFSVTTTNPVQGSPVTLDASASTDPDPGVTITSYTWNFGDGTSASTTTATVTHTYAQPGSYTITLTATNSIGLSGQTTGPVGVDELPTAAFALTPASPVPGAAVSFNAGAANDPDGSIASYSWTFGDGTGATSPTPVTSHAYAAPGSYPVTLTVTDSDGQSASSTVAVNVYTSPSAAFTAGPQAPLAGSPVSFDAGASVEPNPGATITGYAWSFGDGATGTGVSPTHTFARSGTYTVTLTTTDSLGLTATDSQSVTVDAPPVPALAAPAQQALINLPVTLSASTSDPNPGATIESYQWDFGDGTTTTTTGPTASHTYTTTGQYTVSVTVTDSLDLSAATTRSLTVRALPESAFSATPAMPLEGAPVSFDAGSSTDPNGAAITRYAWSFGDGGTATTTAASAGHTYARAGTYTVTLTTTDGLGLSSSRSGTIVVADETPTASARLLTGTALATRAVDFSGSLSRDADGSIVAYRWSFGDGAAATGVSPTHAFAHPGSYAVTLVVTDSGGERASTTISVRVGTPTALTGTGLSAGKGGPVLLLTLSEPGRLRVARHTSTVRRAGTVRVHLQLTRAQARQLARHHSVRLRVPVSFTSRTGLRSSTVLTIIVRAAGHGRDTGSLPG
jgi:PKD repeat protein